jgi:acyl-CoA reductase-like NAD-dependent aldehyde dehydrogenase
MIDLVITNPSTLDAITVVQLHKALEVEEKMANALSFFQNKNAWLSVTERSEKLAKFKSLLLEEKHSLVTASLSEGGKPYNDTVGEFDRAVNGVDLAIDHLKKAGQEEVSMGLNPSSENKKAYTLPEPCGVVLAISAFNHPMNLVIHQVIPALAAGCPVIMKPASTTPLVARSMITLLVEAGFPSEMCQYLICSNEQTAQLAQDRRLSFVSFIGSSKVGWEIRSKLAPGVRCVLEHGGVAPLIALDDFDEVKLVKDVLKGAFYHAGQVCVSVQRLFLPRGKYSLIDDLVEKTNQLLVGDAKNEDTEVGPIITTAGCERIHSWVEEAIEEGAKLLCGGEKIGSNYYRPTILLNPSSKSKISELEVFGPVLCIYEYDDTSDAILMANNLPFEFQAAVFCNDIERAKSVASELKATAVMINTHTAFRVDWMPFGGAGDSGLGTGGIGYSIDDMTKRKLFVIDES